MAGAVAVPHGVGHRIYIFGGAEYVDHTLQYLDSCEFLDVGDSQWTLIGTKMDTPRWHTRAVLLDDKTIVICGGTATDGKSTSACDMFDLATHTFSPFPDMEMPRSNHAGVRYMGTIVVLGGFYGRETCEQFDPTIGKWALFPPCRALAGGAHADVVADKIYAVSAMFVTSDIYVYDGSAWGAVSIAVKFTGAVAELGGRLCIFNSYNKAANGCKNTLHMYDTSTEPWTVSYSDYSGAYDCYDTCVSF